jgi:hypothetical protein
LGLAAAAALIGRGRRISYRPILIGPSVSCEILGPPVGVRSNSDSAVFLLDQDLESTSYLHFRKLRSKGAIGGNNLKLEDPIGFDQMLSRRLDSDPELHLVSPFPHYVFQAKFGKGSRTPTDRMLSIIVAGERVYDSALSMIVATALRDAWLELLTNNALLRQLIHVLLRDRNYTRKVTRLSGLHFVPHQVFAGDRVL